MAKGYMIYVEDGDTPKKVHVNVHSAWREMMRLADINEGKSIMILQITKRMMKKPGEEKAVSIGSHLPLENIGNMVKISDLVSRVDLPKPEKKAKNNKSA